MNLKKAMVRNENHFFAVRYYVLDRNYKLHLAKVLGARHNTDGQKIPKVLPKMALCPLTWRADFQQDFWVIIREIIIKYYIPNPYY